MCGRFTNKLTWAEIVALYRLTMDRPPHNMRADYNVCPTDAVDTVVERDGQGAIRGRRPCNAVLRASGNRVDTGSAEAASIYRGSVGHDAGAVSGSIQCTGLSGA